MLTIFLKRSGKKRLTNVLLICPIITLIGSVLIVSVGMPSPLAVKDGTASSIPSSWEPTIGYYLYPTTLLLSLILLGPKIFKKDKDVKNDKQNNGEKKK